MMALRKKGRKKRVEKRKKKKKKKKRQPLDKSPHIHGSSTKPALHTFGEKQEEDDKIKKYA